MNSRYWSLFISILLLSSLPIAHVPISDAVPVINMSITDQKGPCIWTHSGPKDISDLEGLYSTGYDTDSQYLIVQFFKPIDDEILRLLTLTGATVLDYFPDNAFVIRLNGMDPGEIGSLPGVMGTSSFFPGLKIHPDILASIKEGGGSIDGFSSVTVETFTGESIDHELAISGHRYVRTKETRYVVDMPVSISVLMEIDGVKWIEPRSDMRTFNNQAEKIIDVDIVWDDLGLDGSGQVIGISDTGLDTGVDDHDVDGDMHLDLDNRAIIRDWTGGGSEPDDGNGHGTHVAGSVAGNGARSNGNIKGMAYNSTIFFQALETDDGWLNSPSNLSQLFTQAYNGGARIHTNSWGSSSSHLYGAYTAESYDVDWSMFQQPDMLILFAAGNNGKDSDSNGKIDPNSVSPPSTAKSGLAVGASENVRSSGGYQGTWGNGWPADYPADPIYSDRPSNNSNGLAAFSSRGPLNDGRFKPDVVAPGTNILSTRSSLAGSSGWGWYNSTYVYYGGTSMSTPITAGMAALVREFYNSTLGMDSPSAALLKATMINGAQDISPGQYGAASATTREIDRRPDMDQGWGRINLKESVNPEAKILTFVDNSSGLSTGRNLSRMFRVTSSFEDLRVTLAWSDYPGSLFSGKQLINDLDLILEAPNGDIYNGNDFQSPFDDTTDTINPVEGVSISDPLTGWWKVTVEGANVPRGPQHFALVGTGNMTQFITNDMILDRMYYSTNNDTITVSLTSNGLAGIGSMVARINSTSDPIGKNVIMMEEGNFGSFSGQIVTSNRSTTDSGRIHVSHDDRILVRYESPIDIVFTADAIAKIPRRVDLIRLKENMLVYSTNDSIRLKGVGDPSLYVHWTVPGSDLPWIGLFDDGLETHNDPVAGDGDYNTAFFISDPYHASGNITLRVKDPFLGYIQYEQFHIDINSSRPGAPADLEAVPVSTGNTVMLKWKRSPSSDISHHRIYLNDTLEPTLALSDWSLYTITDDSSNITIVEGLKDGIEYLFRVSAVNIYHNESSPSFSASAIPYDDTPPIIEYSGSPEVLTGVATMEFIADNDLERLELQYYIDENMDGDINDNGTFISAVNSSSNVVVWDTRISSGGPGDLDRMILRFRGYDEVPNISNWTYVSGFGIDNTGPQLLELVTYPPRVTNGTLFDITGMTEPLAKVTAELNGVELNEIITGSNGLFYLSIELVEGENHLNLTAYDLHGAGPLISNHIFTRDTMDPVALIRGFDPVVEINSGYTPVISDSYDRGLDFDLSRISNHTWTLTGPYGATYVSFGRTFEKIYYHIGDYELELKVKDNAMNWDVTGIGFKVVDMTPPVAVINGPETGNEDTTHKFNIEGSRDNDPSFPSSESFVFEWEFTGPGGFIRTSDRTDPFVLFPDPGVYFISLAITDSGGNTGKTTRTIIIHDITPPDIELKGESSFYLNERGDFTVEVFDNDPDHLDGTTYLWQLVYNDETDNVVATSSLETFTYNFTVPGNYTLTIRVTDPSENGRNDSIMILVKVPPGKMFPSDEEEELNGTIPVAYMLFGAAIIAAIIVLIGASLIARRRDYDEVEAEWEDEDDDWDDDDWDDMEEEIDWDDD